MKTKVNGFTLLEAMVSILLSSLLVSFTFSIYKNFNQYYFIYSGQTERLNNILHFKRTFNQDWNKALTITGKDKQINLSNNQKSITYQFLDSTIVRYGLIETTFDLIPKDLDLKTEIESEKVTNFNLEVVNNRQSFLFSYIKDYGKKDLIINTLNNN